MTARAAIVAGSRANSVQLPDLELIPVMLLEVGGALARLGLPVESPSDTTAGAFQVKLDETLAVLGAKDDDTALVLYLAGHGKTNGNSLRIEFADRAISLDQVLEQVSEVVDEAIVFIDACGAGAALRIAEGMFNDLKPKARIAILMSSIGREVTYEGVFGKALASSLASARSPFGSEHIAPRQLRSAIQRLCPQSQIDIYADRRDEDRRYKALPNPLYGKGRREAWYQAEANDPRWTYVERPELQQRLRNAMQEGSPPAGTPADAVTIFAAPPDSGKSTVLRWLANPERKVDGGSAVPVYIDCRDQTPGEIEHNLLDKLGLDHDDLLAGLASRDEPIGIILDEAGPINEVWGLAMAIAETHKAWLVIALSQTEAELERFQSRFQIIDFDHTLRDEGVAARRKLVTSMLGGIKPTGAELVDEIMAAAKDSFLLAYLYASAGAVQATQEHTHVAGLSAMLLGTFLKKIESALIAKRGNDPLRTSVRNLVGPLALAEGLGLNIEMLSSLSGELDLETDEELRVVLFEVLESALESSMTIYGEAFWRLQPMHLVFAARSDSDAEEIHRRFISHFLNVLSNVAQASTAEVDYARLHLSEHLRHADEFARIEHDPRVLLALSREHLVRSLQRAGTTGLGRLATCLSLAGEGADAVEQLVLVAGAYGLNELETVARREMCLYSSIWLTKSRPQGIWRVGTRILLAGVVAVASRGVYGVKTEDNSALVDAVATDSGGVVVVTARGALLRWTDVSLDSVMTLNNAVQSVDLSEGKLTVASSHGLHIRSLGNPEEPGAELGRATVFRVRRSGGGLFALSAETLHRWDRNDEYQPLPLPLSDTGPFVSMATVEDGVFVATGGGGLWHARPTGPWRLVWRGAKGRLQFDVLDLGDVQLFATCDAGGRVQIHEARQEKVDSLHEVRFHRRLGIDGIALRSKHEILLSTEFGVVLIDFHKDEFEQEAR